MYKIVLVRHGESQWNLENKFTGWVDVDLSEKGVKEAKKSGQLLKKNNYNFTVCYTSFLKRAIKTNDIILEELDLMYLPVIKHWRLNERHYGGLTGLNKAETAEKHSKEQVHIWRRSFDVPPPKLDENDPRHPKFDRKYKILTTNQLPATESLKMTIERVMPYWEVEIAPAILRGEQILISAHGNSLRALVKYLDKISDSEIPGFEIPTGVPLVYELDKDLQPIKRYYLEN
jgi:2,3-bisphosphoglycerate-dependent phosphoglycerate mutase